MEKVGKLGKNGFWGENGGILGNNGLEYSVWR